MAYSVIERHVWHDEKFRSLSRDARELFLYLLTSPHSNRLGMYVLDRFYVASDLQMEPAAVDGALAELVGAERIAYDPRTRLVLIRRFLKHNPLKNPNVVTAACGDLAGLPFSERLWELLHDAVKHWGKSFYKQLREQLAKRLGDKTANQDPEPEQDQKPDPDPRPSRAVAASPDEAAADAADEQPPPPADIWTDELKATRDEIADSYCTTARERRSFTAATDMLIADPLAHWRNPHTGDPVPTEKRPDLYRTAALHHFAKPENNLASSLVYTLKRHLDPSRDPEATKEAATAADRRLEEQRKRDAEVEADRKRIRLWKDEHPDELAAITAEVYAEPGAQGMAGQMYVDAKVNQLVQKRISESRAKKRAG